MKDILNNFRSKLNEMMIDDAIDLILDNNRIHNPSTGRFRKGKAQKGDVISLSKPAAERAGIDTKYAERSIATGNRDKDGRLKGTALYGMNSGDKQCGRLNPQGEEVPVRKSCSQYPKDYLEEADVLIDENDERIDKEYWRATIKNAIRDEIQKALKSNSCSLSDITRGLNMFARSADGKLNEPPKGNK